MKKLLVCLLLSLPGIFTDFVAGQVHVRNGNTLTDRFGYTTGTITGPFMPRDYLDRYTYPVQKIECDGRDFEAKAVVTYRYNNDTKKFGVLFLQVFLKPLDNSGMTNRDYIATQDYHGTLVYQECFDKGRTRFKFKGKADTYARVFSPFVVTVEDELELEYAVNFDVKNPAKNSAEYKLSKSPWPEPDGSAIFTTPPNRAYRASWTDVVLPFEKFRSFYPSESGYRPFGRYWDKAFLLARIVCFNQVGDVEMQGTEYDKTNPGRIMSYVDMHVSGMKGDTTQTLDVIRLPIYETTENKTERYTVGSNEKGEVTMEESTFVRLGLDQRFFAHTNDLYGLKFRAYAKCRYIPAISSENEKQMCIERATLTYMLYN